MSKQYLTLTELKQCNAKLVARFDKHSTKTFGDITRPGYYFVLSQDENKVQARYFSGRQRTKQGFKRTINHILTGRSEVSRSLVDKGELFAYYIPVEKIKALLNLNRSFLVKVFSQTASDKFENISECNQLLSDHYKFVLQDY